jgi:hypothetical protein
VIFVDTTSSRACGREALVSEAAGFGALCGSFGDAWTFARSSAEMWWPD